MRLAAQMKAGYYPFDPEIARQLAGRMEWPESGFFLDPCCGCGEALRAWVPDVPFYTLHGVELSSERADKAAAGGVHHVLNAAFEHTRMTESCFSGAWVNPPFDDELGGGGRVELKFLKTVTGLLVPGGLILLVAKTDRWSPARQAGPMMTWLNSYYDNVRAFWLPDSDRPGYSYTSTVVYLGNKRKSPVASDKVVSIHEWTKESEWLRWSIPDSKGPVLWKATSVTDEQLARMADASPLLKRKVGGNVEIGRPPLPLKLGHIPMVLASGRFNGTIKDHVARAKISKSWKTKETQTRPTKDGTEKEVLVQKEEVRLSIKVLYRHAGIAAIKSFDMEHKTNEQSCEPVT